MCVHYWLIDSKDYGKCKNCGKEKDFRPLQEKVFLREGITLERIFPNAGKHFTLDGMI